MGRRPAGAWSRGTTALAAILFLIVSAVLLSIPVRLNAASPGSIYPPPAAVGSLAADTIRGDESGTLWTKDKLKSVLEEQSSGATSGGTGKSARIAMLCTLVFPGLGQMYNERPVKAMIALSVETFYLSKILLNHRYFQRAERLRDNLPPGSSEWKRQDWWVDEYKERRRDWIWWSGGMLVVLLIDSYVDAHLYDMRVSVEGIAVQGGGGVGIVLAF